MNLPMAKWLAKRFLERDLENIDDAHLVYPEYTCTFFYGTKGGAVGKYTVLREGGCDSYPVTPSLKIFIIKRKRWLTTTIFLSVTCYNVTMLTTNYYNGFLSLGNRK